MKQAFPDSIPLNGADCFLLQIDRLMWSQDKRRNVCSFVAHLEAEISLHQLQAELDEKPAYHWLSRLRLNHALPFCLPHWKENKQARPQSIQEHKLSQDSIPEQLISIDINPYKDQSFQMDLLQTPTQGSILVFNWHHVLMDARGGENLLRYLFDSTVNEPEHCLHKPPSPLPLRERAEIAREMKEFLYQRACLPLLTLQTCSDRHSVINHRFVRFTREQTEQIHQTARGQGAVFLYSAFYLAATARAVAQIQQQRGEPIEDLVIPVPLDTRLKGDQQIAIGNPLSFLFYRLPKDTVFDVSHSTKALIGQMQSFMREDRPNRYRIMLDFLRRIPGFFYRAMLKAPTQGQIASFSFSDTGETLDDLTRCFNTPIASAFHYPPNLTPPGLTFIFSRAQGQLQISIAYSEAVISDEEMTQLLNHLQSNLGT